MKKDYKMSVKGFKAVAGLKVEQDARRARFGEAFVPFFMMRDGEMIEGLWFVGTEDEPLVVDCHTKQAKSASGKAYWKTIIHKSEGDCIPCYLQLQGDKTVSKMKQIAVFSVADPRWRHKAKDEAKSKETGREKYVFSDCSNDDDGDGDCPGCRNKIPRDRAGIKKWEMSLSWANSLGNINSALRNKCECGGKIKKDSCSRCDNPRPLNIFKVPFNVERSGSSTSTTYQFHPQPYEDQPSWVQEVEPLDLDKIYEEPSADAQCNLMGIDNPLKNMSRGKRPPVDDTEEDIFG
jgi:hypothetical protein